MVKDNVTLGAQDIAFCVSGKSRQNLVSQGWNINDEGDACSGNRPFVTTWRTTSTNDSISIPTSSEFVYNYDIDWDNDGAIDITNVTGNITHIYPAAGDHRVAIYGDFAIDSYWLLDPDGSEVSVETGLKTRSVSNPFFKQKRKSSPASFLSP